MTNRSAISLLCVAVLGVTAVAVEPALAGNRAPKMVKARLKDRDGNGMADRVVITYSERIRHKKDRDGRYPFRVEGYKIAKVGRARGTRKLIVHLKETGTAPEEPRITYRRTRRHPVKDMKGKQARKQSFRDTIALDVVAPPGEVYLKVRRDGQGSGFVTSDDGSIDCGNTCTAFYPLEPPAAVTLSATADEGSTFAGWTGACVADPCTLAMTEDRQVTAVFEPVEVPDDGLFTLTVETTGPGSVSSVPAGIDCGTDCTEDYAADSIVTLTASWDPLTADFVGWSGGGCSGTGLCVVTMNSDVTVTATFVSKDGDSGDGGDGGDGGDCVLLCL